MTAYSFSTTTTGPLEDARQRVVDALAEQGFEVCSLEADARLTLFEHRPSGHAVFVLGNETTGVSAPVSALADTALAIPMNNGVESLNVAVTASLIAYADRIG